MDYRLDLYNAVENFQQQMTDGDALFIICNTKQGDLLVGLDVGINIISSVRANDNGYVNIENKEPKIVNERAKRIVLNMAINILRTDVNLLKKFDVARASPLLEELTQALELAKSKLKVAEQALNDIIKWDDDLEDEWGDPGERANSALEKIMILDGF